MNGTARPFAVPAVRMSLLRWWLNLVVPHTTEHEDRLPDDPLLSENQGPHDQGRSSQHHTNQGVSNDRR